jgi:hypothetical protein
MVSGDGILTDLMSWEADDECLKYQGENILLYISDLQTAEELAQNKVSPVISTSLHRYCRNHVQ